MVCAFNWEVVVSHDGLVLVFFACRYLDALPFHGEIKISYKKAYVPEQWLKWRSWNSHAICDYFVFVAWNFLSRSGNFYRDTLALLIKTACFEMLFGIKVQNCHKWIWCTKRNCLKGGLWANHPSFEALAKFDVFRIVWRSFKLLIQNIKSQPISLTGQGQKLE